ncbi:MAG: helix-turn-helix domain-containing protein, partial [Oscillospiraceae bacterium]|nr:helix-turn-helix domain-containing protein [Oscillospiraceae bacterium]
MIRTQLREMKERCGLSNKELADRSGVSLPTVNRIMSGETDSPGYQTVCDLVMAMGGSLDELAGIRPTTEVQSGESVEFYKQLISEKDTWLKRLFIITCFLISVIVFVVIFDIMHPYIGCLLYTSPSPRDL